MEEKKRAEKKRGKKKKFTPVQSMISHAALCVGAIVYMELVFHMFIFKSVGSFIYYPILFALPVGFFILAVTGLFKKKVNKIIMWVLLSFVTLIYVAETIYTYIFKVPLLFTDVGAGNLQAVVYYREMLAAVLDCLPILLLLFVPLVAYGVLLKLGMVTFKKAPLISVVYALAMLVFAGFGLLTINLSDKEKSSVYDNYHDMFDTMGALENFGVFTTLRLNAKDLLFPKSSQVDVDDFEIGPPVNVDLGNNNNTVDNEEPDFFDPDDLEWAEIIDTSPNAMDIDFVSLAENESDKNIKALHQYFASIVPSNKNEYTGMFEGYNLIYITAEAFSPYCVDKEVTPTLYKLVNEGFVFNNFYVPVTGESTCGGEFMNCTGLITNPNRPRGVYTFVQTKDNYMPFSMGNQFAREGITSYAYHNNSLSYYSRYLTLPNLGYVFKASTAGTLSAFQSEGLIFEMEHPKQWPQSDLEMIQATKMEYITKDQPFHAYYMTVSGHMNYTFVGNSMSYKNKEAVADLPYSENCKAYIACNIELDRALEDLINQLEEAGVLDKTVICMSADHYPYGLTNEEISELAGHKIEENFELYKNNLILWNSAMEEPIVVDKPCTSIDIIPTLSNLFGFSYDSRLLPGTDILSDTEAFVIMVGNRSVITDKIMYNASTRKVTDLQGNPVELSSEELNAIKNKVNLKMAMNQLVIEEDYYNVIKDKLVFE